MRSSHAVPTRFREWYKIWRYERGWAPIQIIIWHSGSGNTRHFSLDAFWFLLYEISPGIGVNGIGPNASGFAHTWSGLSHQDPPPSHTHTCTQIECWQGMVPGSCEWAQKKWVSVRGSPPVHFSRWYKNRGKAISSYMFSHWELIGTFNLSLSETRITRISPHFLWFRRFVTC